VEIRDRVIVVTGGGNGIGAALARRFAAEGARGVVVADIDGDAASGVAADIDGIALQTDVRDESAVQGLVSAAEARYGPVDLFCSNAGIGTRGGLEMGNEEWRQIWDVNLMAHVYAARAVLPSMLERGGGYLLQTSSAAGLLTNIGSRCRRSALSSSTPRCSTPPTATPRWWRGCARPPSRPRRWRKPWSEDSPRNAS
jgi:NAD(P)-dependent dehydrogenase (short-subunit alcohol dehydrogenase family)